MHTDEEIAHFELLRLLGVRLEYAYNHMLPQWLALPDLGGNNKVYKTLPDLYRVTPYIILRVRPNDEESN